MSEVAAVILAAGRSTRFAANQSGTTKLVAELHGKPLVRHVADAALASRARPVIVVTGHGRELVQGALAGLQITFVHNENYATGLASSLRAGVAAVPPEPAGAIILLGDMPLITADLMNHLIRRLEENSELDAIAPLTHGRRGNPVLLARSLLAEVAGLSGDEGARRLLQTPWIRVLEIPIGGDAAAADIDTPESLEEWRQKQSQGTTRRPATT
jgi:molybdenum cofactor cytidylyltransferase